MTTMQILDVLQPLFALTAIVSGFFLLREIKRENRKKNGS